LRRSDDPRGPRGKATYQADAWECLAEGYASAAVCLRTNGVPVDKTPPPAASPTGIVFDDE
jgi:hypothetical protein